MLEDDVRLRGFRSHDAAGRGLASPGRRGGGGAVPVYEAPLVTCRGGGSGNTTAYTILPINYSQMMT